MDDIMKHPEVTYTKYDFAGGKFTCGGCGDEIPYSWPHHGDGILRLVVVWVTGPFQEWVLCPKCGAGFPGDAASCYIKTINPEHCFMYKRCERC